MSLTDGRYSPDKMLSLCSVNAFERYEKRDALVTRILAIVATHKAGEETKLIESLGSVLPEYGKISIGTALDKLHSISTLQDELDEGWDGLEALCYHLSGHTATKGIEALQKVMRRFDKLSKEQDEKNKKFKQEYEAKRAAAQGV